MEEPEYDPVTCVSAGELRALGIPVPEQIPDCGWIRRSSMVMAIKPGTSQAEDGYSFKINFEVKFTEAFHWVVANFIITKEETDK